MMFIFSTYPNRTSARKATGLVVKKRFAGCVLTIPVGSIYQWKGKIENAKEVLVIFKTTKGKARKLMEFLEAHHPYEVPFVAAMPLHQVNKTYREWLGREVDKQ